MGYDYPINWDEKPENCICSVMPKISCATCDENAMIECTYFCNALFVLIKFASLTHKQALERILSDLSKAARMPSDSLDKIQIFVGAGALLYFYNTKEDDQIIRNKISKDNKILKRFFDPMAGYQDFAWLYNRPERAKWASLIDSLNGDKKDWFLMGNIDSLLLKPEYQNVLRNPFRIHANDNESYKLDSICYCKRMSILETELKNKSKLPK